jgi:hypothetical protein
MPPSVATGVAALPDSVLANPAVSPAPTALPDAVRVPDAFVRILSPEARLVLAQVMSEAAPPEGGVLPPLPAPSSAASANAAPPPFRGGATVAQGAQSSTLPADADAAAAARHLLSGSDAALAHQKLLQLASLPEAAQTAARGPANSQWMFEIPFATPQGTAMAQFVIERDGRGNSAEGEANAPVWRVRFSIDVEPLGPVHAQLVLSGPRAWVSLWADRSESLARLRGDAEILNQAFRASDLEAEIAFQPAERKATPPGRFVDRAS